MNGPVSKNISKYNMIVCVFLFFIIYKAKFSVHEKADVLNFKERLPRIKRLIFIVAVCECLEASALLANANGRHYFEQTPGVHAGWRLL